MFKSTFLRIVAIFALMILTPFTILKLLGIAARDYISWLRIEWASIKTYTKD